MNEGHGIWRYPREFWTANVIELFERAAYYGTFITLVVYLTSVVGFTDVQAGWIGAGFASMIYFLPFLTGAAADRIGFRNALLVAFSFLAVGYGVLGLLPEKTPVLFALAAIVVGGSFVKPVITGTVARTSDVASRARAYSLFYMMVNIGSFSGKTIARPVRVAMGLDHVPLCSAAAACVALLLVAFLFRPGAALEEGRAGVAETLRGMGQALRNFRFLALILITAGFWAIQGQLYASMPKYVLRLVGEGASPEWYANVNPLVVVALVVPVTHLVAKLPPVRAIGIALAIIPFSALAMALAPVSGREVHVLGVVLHPITVAMVAGIALQGLAECFLSPRYLEYASRQAPAGQEGLYLGYAHMNTFFAWLFGFALSGYLLDAFCPDPATLTDADQARRLAALAGNGPMPAAYGRAHVIWYVFAGVGLLAFLLLLLYEAVTARLDRKARTASFPAAGPAA